MPSNLKDRLKELKDCLDDGLITEAEYAEEKRKALAELSSSYQGVAPPQPPIAAGVRHEQSFDLASGAFQPGDGELQCRNGHRMHRGGLNYRASDPGESVGGADEVPPICAYCKVLQTDLMWYRCPGDLMTGDCGYYLCSTCFKAGVHERPERKSWSTGLCSCCKFPGVAADSFLCYMCMLPYTYTVLHNTGVRTDVAVGERRFEGDKCCPLACIFVGDLLGMMGVMNGCFGGQLRNELAESFGIQEGFGSSFFKHWLCPCCSMAQMHNELIIRNCYLGGICMKYPGAQQVYCHGMDHGEDEMQVRLTTKQGASTIY